jgi:RNA polymerase sigma-70 factor (ECF subfamily)
MTPTLDQLADEDLALRTRGGSMPAFEELVRRYQVPLMRFLVRRFGNLHDAEDAVQEALAKAYTSIAEYDDQYAFRTWIFTITYRVAVSRHRKNKTTLDIANHEPLKPAGVDELEQEEEKTRLWDIARRTLSEDQFTVIWMYYVEEMPTRDIAKVLGRSWVSVKTMMFRARSRLQEKLSAPDARLAGGQI